VSELNKNKIRPDNLQMIHIMFNAELNATVCNGPMRGKQFTYALLDERVASTKPFSREESLAELSLRYFRSHGPATIQDFTWWSGLPAADARNGLEMIKSKLASEKIGAYALSEAASGSDAFAMQTRAVDSGDHFVINGRKLWITNGKEAEIFVLFANANPEAGYRGITAFIVEKGFAGFTVGKKENKLGIRASSTTELILEDCKVPKENVLGEVGKGYKTSIETLNEGRIGIGAQMIGLARGALECALRYTTERQQFGKSINQFQGLQFQLAEMATDLEAARLMVYNAARMKDAGQNFVKEAAMAKLYSSRAAERITSKAIEMYGGYGYVKDYPVEKYWRDSKIGAIYEGTSNMQLQTIAKLIIGK